MEPHNKLEAFACVFQTHAPTQSFHIIFFTCAAHSFHSSDHVSMSYSCALYFARCCDMWEGTRQEQKREKASVFWINKDPGKIKGEDAVSQLMDAAFNRWKHDSRSHTSCLFSFIRSILSSPDNRFKHLARALVHCLELLPDSHQKNYQSNQKCC